MSGLLDAAMVAAFVGRIIFIILMTIAGSKLPDSARVGENCLVFIGDYDFMEFDPNLNASFSATIHTGLPAYQYKVAVSVLKQDMTDAQCFLNASVVVKQIGDGLFWSTVGGPNATGSWSPLRENVAAHASLDHPNEDEDGDFLLDKCGCSLADTGIWDHSALGYWYHAWLGIIVYVAATVCKYTYIFHARRRLHLAMTCRQNDDLRAIMEMMRREKPKEQEWWWKWMHKGVRILFRGNVLFVTSVIPSLLLGPVASAKTSPQYVVFHTSSIFSANVAWIGISFYAAYFVSIVVSMWSARRVLDTSYDCYTISSVYVPTGFGCNPVMVWAEATHNTWEAWLHYLPRSPMFFWQQLIWGVCCPFIFGLVIFLVVGFQTDWWTFSFSVTLPAMIEVTLEWDLAFVIDMAQIFLTVICTIDVCTAFFEERVLKKLMDKKKPWYQKIFFFIV